LQSRHSRRAGPLPGFRQPVPFAVADFRAQALGSWSMDLTYSPEDIAFRQRVREWFSHNAPKAELKTLAERKAWIRKLYDAGFVGMGWPKEYGGQDARPMEQAIVADEMARSNSPSTGNGLGLSSGGPTIIHHGTQEQKTRYPRQILTAQASW